MNPFRKSIRNLVLATALAATATIAAPANSAVIQLGFILDRSGSIGGANWNTIIDGLSNAVLNKIPVGGADTYEVSVVSFASSASIDIANFLVTDATARSNLSTAIFNLGDGRSNDKYIGGTTNFQDAYIKMLDALDNTVLGPDSKSYVNFATDGVQNPNPPTGVTERNALIAAGVDNISIEGIGSGVDATDLKNNFCYPGPCTVLPTVNFPSQGFYLGVANAQGYADAIGNKILIVTQQVPEPCTLALLGLGLAGLGFGRRKQA